jgi:hypothetical protein
MRSLIAVVGLVLAVGPSSAAAAPVRGADYVGSFGGRGNVSFSVSSDGKRLYAPQVTDLPARCDGQPGTASFRSGSPELFARIRRNNHFYRTLFITQGYTTIRGDFLSGGRVRGQLNWDDKICIAPNTPFTARARRRPGGLTGLVFHYAGDGSDRPQSGLPATATSIRVAGVDELPDGALIVADSGGAIRRIDRDGRVRTLLDSGDGIVAPADVAVTPDGGYLFTEPALNCVRRVAPDGTLSTAAGRCEQGNGGFAGDGDQATAALLSGPKSLALPTQGGFLVSDGGGSGTPSASNRRVRRVAPDGTISTAAGTGLDGSTGDGAPATAATFRFITDVDAEPDGGFLIADRDAYRVRRVAPDGTISTAAGTGFGGFAGDGGPATSARLEPVSVEALGSGAFLVTDGVPGRLRRVSVDRRIRTVAGAGEVATGVPARQAALLPGNAMALLGNGTIAMAGTLIAGPTERRLLVGLPARRVTYQRAIVRRGGMPIRVTRRTRATVVLLRRGRPLRRVRVNLPRGRSTVRLPRAARLRKRTTYRLLVRVKTDNAVATATMTFYRLR